MQRFVLIYGTWEGPMAEFFDTYEDAAAEANNSGFIATDTIIVEVANAWSFDSNNRKTAKMFQLEIQ